MHLSDCYRLLGVTRDASMEDIKQAYRRLARKYHPDANLGDPAAADKFRLVQEAYQMLKDVEAGLLPKQFQPTPSPTPTTPTAKTPPRSPAKPPAVKIERAPSRAKVKDVRQQTDPIDPKVKLRLDMIQRVRELLRQKKYPLAIAIMEGMAKEFPNSPDVIHWQAVCYHRQGCELSLAGKLRQAEAYLNKALQTDPNNRELVFEVRRALEIVAEKMTKTPITEVNSP